MADLRMGASLGISELKIDEHAAFGREEAKVHDHCSGDADANDAGVENLFEPRLKNELVEPDDCDQQQHQRRDLRRVPDAAEDARDDQARIAERSGTEENPSETDEGESGELLREV